MLPYQQNTPMEVIVCIVYIVSSLFSLFSFLFSFSFSYFGSSGGSRTLILLLLKKAHMPVLVQSYNSLWYWRWDSNPQRLPQGYEILNLMRFANFATPVSLVNIVSDICCNVNTNFGTPRRGRTLTKRVGTVHATLYTMDV